jgi:hypothetical protein
MTKDGSSVGFDLSVITVSVLILVDTNEVADSPATFDDWHPFMRVDTIVVTLLYVDGDKLQPCNVT